MTGTYPSRAAQSSPRTWGCFLSVQDSVGKMIVFPTHVGVFPNKKRSFMVEKESSPRTWGCFYGDLRHWRIRMVFPTHVGVFLGMDIQAPQGLCLPHARGGVSATGEVCVSFVLSSPRTWGCFRIAVYQRCLYSVFPTHVGVFPVLRLLLLEEHCLPHARGGVSSPPTLSRESFSSSPRTWGCFCPDTEKRRVPAVFPTHVGVFPSTPPSRGWSRSLPHARGGVSGHQTTCAHPQQSSPRTWGCFRSSRRGRST